MNVKSYRDLDIYKLAHVLAVDIHKMALNLPRFELYEEGSQIRRSSKSVVSNIVEGFARKRYRNDFIRFLFYSLSSCDETREHLRILFETKSLRDEGLFKYFMDTYSELGKKLNNFLRTVICRHNKG